ncbi:MAG: class I SAM-dependent methyltransferase [Chloroflexota bacterium]
MNTLTLDNQVWVRHQATSYVRRMLRGETPGAWAHNTETEVQFAVAQLGLRPGDRVLDLACGWGRHSLELASYGLNVTGLDLSHELLTLARYHARRRGLHVHWVEADVARLPLRGSFDAVAQFCGNLITWFADRHETLNALTRLASLLRPGGRLLFGTDDWRPELPGRSQHWDEWNGGAAIYRQRFDARRRMAEMQMVVFGPGHAREEFWRQTWWPSHCQMEALFEQAGLVVRGRFNTCADEPYDPAQEGLVYVLERRAG